MCTKSDCEQFLDAQDKLSETVARIKTKYRGRGAKCGRGGSTFKRKDRPGQYVHVGFDCGRSDCGYCHGQRLQGMVDRAWKLIMFGPRPELDDKEDGIRIVRDEATGPTRSGELHVGYVDWDSWETFSRWLQRNHGDEGRLRLRLVDFRALVIAEKPFPGSSPMSPAAAAELFLSLVEKMSPAKHSFRALGKWAEAPVETSGEWEKIAAPFDQETVTAIAESFQAKVSRLGCKGHFFSIVFQERTPTQILGEFETALLAAARLRGRPCRTLGIPSESPIVNKPTSRTADCPNDWRDPWEVDDIPLAA